MRIESIITNRKLDFNIQLEDFLIVFIGFFISRVNILGNLTPFGIAFLGSYLLLKKSNIYLLISVILGIFTFHGINGTSYYIISILLYFIFTKTKEGKRYTLIKSSFISGLLFILFRFLSIIIIGKYLLYDLFMITFEGILIFTMTYIFSFSLPIEDIKVKNVSNEKLVCSFITMALVLSGFNNVVIFGLNIKNIISIIMVIYLSYTQGVLIGTSSGIVLGLVSYISHTEMPFIISILAVGGLLAGLFRDLGKSGSILGFVLGNGIISFYINKFGISFLAYKELLFSSIIFLVISKYLDFDLNTIFIGIPQVEKDYGKKKDKFVAKKLNNIGNLFDSISNIFQRSIQDEDFYSTMEGYNIVDEICNKTCKNCPKYKNCWEENYYNTYAKIFNFIGTIESNGTSINKFPSDIIGSCQYRDILTNNVIKYYENLEKDYIWNKRLIEQRNLLGEQLEGLGKIIKDIANDVYSNTIINSELEDLLIKELKNRRIDISNLTVVEIEKDNFEIEVELGGYIGNIKYMEKIKKIISDSLNIPLTIDFTYCNIGHKRNNFKLYKANRFATLTEVSTAANSENRISGDSYTFGEIDKTAFLAISDGMGIGRKANIESSIAIELLEKLMEINMNKNIIIRTINSVLRAKSNDEIFTTLDLGFIDLYTGKLQILKTGSPATFIKKKDRVEIINSSSLPIGILENVDFNIYEEILEDGDIVIMMSDGILDSNKDVGNIDIWMRDIISRIDSQNPKIIADEILKIAEFVSINGSKDDMTVMATKIWKRT